MAIKAKVLGREALTRNLERLTPGVTEAAAKAKLEVAQEAANRIRAAVPKKTGEFAASIVGERQADNPGKLPVGGKQSKDPDATAIYADYRWRWIEFGTAPHLIKGKNGGNLVFRATNGALVETRSVNHPGSRAHPAIFPTWKAYRKAAKAKISRAIGQAVKKSLGK